MDRICSIYLVSSFGNAVVSENLETSHKSASVDQESRSQMGRQTILGNARGSTGSLHQLLIQSRLDHIPSKGSLETDQGTNNQGSTSNLLRKHSTGSKKNSRQDKGGTDRTSEHAMGPFIVKDALELFQGHAMVETVISCLRIKYPRLAKIKGLPGSDRSKLLHCLLSGRPTSCTRGTACTFQTLPPIRLGSEEASCP